MKFIKVHTALVHEENKKFQCFLCQGSFDTELKLQKHEKEFHDQTITIFIIPTSIEELENMLRNRGTEHENSIQIRLAKATKEMSMSVLYDYTIENHNIEKTINEVKILINNFL